MTGYNEAVAEKNYYIGNFSSVIEVVKRFLISMSELQDAVTIGKYEEMEILKSAFEVNRTELELWGKGSLPGEVSEVPLQKVGEREYPEYGGYGGYGGYGDYGHAHREKRIRARKVGGSSPPTVRHKLQQPKESSSPEYSARVVGVRYGEYMNELEGHRGSKGPHPPPIKSIEPGTKPGSVPISTLSFSSRHNSSPSPLTSHAPPKPPPNFDYSCIEGGKVNKLKNEELIDELIQGIKHLQRGKSILEEELGIVNARLEEMSYKHIREFNELKSTYEANLDKWGILERELAAEVINKEEIIITKEKIIGNMKMEMGELELENRISSRNMINMGTSIDGDRIPSRVTGMEDMRMQASSLQERMQTSQDIAHPLNESAPPLSHPKFAVSQMNALQQKLAKSEKSNEEYRTTLQGYKKRESNSQNLENRCEQLSNELTKYTHKTQEVLKQTSNNYENAKRQKTEYEEKCKGLELQIKRSSTENIALREELERLMRGKDNSMNAENIGIINIESRTILPLDVHKLQKEVSRLTKERDYQKAYYEEQLLEHRKSLGDDKLQSKMSTEGVDQQFYVLQDKLKRFQDSLIQKDNKMAIKEIELKVLKEKLEASESERAKSIGEESKSRSLEPGTLKKGTGTIKSQRVPDINSQEIKKQMEEYENIIQSLRQRVNELEEEINSIEKPRESKLTPKDEKVISRIVARKEKKIVRIKLDPRSPGSGGEEDLIIKESAPPLPEKRSHKLKEEMESISQLKESKKKIEHLEGQLSGFRDNIMEVENQKMVRENNIKILEEDKLRLEKLYKECNERMKVMENTLPSKSIIELENELLKLREKENKNEREKLIHDKNLIILEDEKKQMEKMVKEYREKLHLMENSLISTKIDRDSQLASLHEIHQGERAKLENKSQEFTQIQDINSDLESRFIRSQKENSEKAEEIMSLEGMLRETKEELSTYTESTDALIADKNSKLIGAKENIENNKREHKKEIEGLKRRIEEIKGNTDMEINKLQRSIVDTSSVEGQEKCQLLSKISELSGHLQESRREKNSLDEDRRRNDETGKLRTIAMEAKIKNQENSLKTQGEEIVGHLGKIKLEENENKKLRGLIENHRKNIESMEGKVKNVDNEKEEKLKGMVKEQEREKEGLKRAGDIEKESMRKEHVTVLENMSHKMNKGKERSQRLSIDITRLQKLLEDAQTKLQGYEENQGALLKKYQDDNQRHKQELKEAKQRAKDLGRDLEEAKLNERDRKVISPTLTKINQKVLEEQRELTNKLQELNSNLETRLIQSQNENSNKTKEIAKLQDMHDTKVKELDNLNKELHNRVKESELKLNKIEENLHHTNKNSEQKVSVMMEEHHFEKDNLHMIHNQEKKDLHLAHSHEKEATREEFMKEMTDKDSKNKKEVKEHKESAIKLKNINAALQAKLSHSEKQFAEKLEELDNLQNTHEKKMKKLDNENSELVKQIKDSDHRKIQISENLDNAHKNIKQKMEEYHFEKENLHLIHNQEKKDLHLAHSHEKEATREEFMKEMTDKDSKNKKEVKEHKESAIKLKNINAALQAKLSHSEKQFAEKLEELDNLQNTHERKMKILERNNSELVSDVKDREEKYTKISENLDNAHKNIKEKKEEHHMEKENLQMTYTQEKEDLHLAHSQEKEASRDEFMAKMREKDSKMNRKKGKVQRSAKENADLASQLADARAQLQDYEENQNFLLKKHQDENNGCRAELKESRQMVKMLTKNIEDLKQIIETPARISPRISEADARLIEDNRNLIKTLKDENSTLEYKFITSQTEIAAKNTKISSLEGLLEGQIDEYKKYKNSNDKLTLENKNKLKEYELMIENHKLFENDQNKRFSTKVSDLQKEKDENVKHLENLNNQIQENEKFANNEREDLTSRVNRKIGKKNRLLNDNNQLMKELEEARDIIKEYEENANTLIRKHQEERNNNKLEIKDKGHKLKSLTEAFNEIVQRKAEHPLEESQNEHQLKLRQQNNILTTRINELQGEHEAQLIEMNKDKNNTEERIIKLERELSQCREELAEDKVSADKKYAEYENKLDKSNQIIENYKLIEIENIKSLTAKQKSWEREKKQNLKQIQDLGIHLEDTHQKQESTKTKYLGELAMINSKLSKKSGKKQRLQGNYEETRLELEAAKIKLKEYEENRENLLKRHQDQIKDNQIELKLHKTKLNWFNRNYDETRDKPDTQIIYAEEPIQMKEIEEQKQIIQNLGKINTKLEERLIASQIQNSERSEEIGNLSHELKAVQNEFESQRAKYENTIADQNMKLNEANLQIKNYHLENENTMNIRTHKNHIKLLQNEKDKEIRKLMSEIENSNQELEHHKNENIKSLEKHSKANNQLQSAENQIGILEGKITEIKRNVTQKSEESENKLKSHEDELKLKSRELISHVVKYKDLEAENKKLEGTIEEYGIKLKELEEKHETANKKGEDKISLIIEEHHFEQANMHKSANEEKESVRDELNRRIESLNSKVKRKKGKTERLQTDNRNSAKELREAESKLEEYEGNRESILRRQQEEKKAMEEEIKGYKREIKETRKNIDNMRSTQTSKEEMKDNIQKQFRELQTQLEEKRGELLRQSQMNSDLEVKCIKAQKLFSGKVKEMEGVEKKLKDSCEELNTSKIAHQRQINSHTEKINSLQQTHTTNQASRTQEVEHAAGETKTLQLLNDSLQNTINDQNVSMANLKEELKIHVKESITKSKLEKEYSELENRNKLNTDENNELVTQMDNQKEIIENMAIEISCIQVALESIRQTTNSKVDYYMQSELNSKIFNEDIKQYVQEIFEYINRLSKKIVEEESKHRELTGILEGRDKTLTEAGEKEKELKIKINKLVESTGKDKSSYLEVRKTVEEKESRNKDNVDQLENIIQNLKLTVESKEGEVAERKKVIDRIMQEVTDQRKKLVEKETIIEELNLKLETREEISKSESPMRSQGDHSHSQLQIKIISDQLMTAQAESLKLKMEIEQKRHSYEEMKKELSILKEEKWKLEVFAENREKIISELQEQADSSVAHFLKNTKDLKHEISRLRKEGKEKGFKLYQIEQENIMMKEGRTAGEMEVVSTVASKDTEIQRKTATIKEKEENIKNLREECHKLTLIHSTQNTEVNTYSRKCEEYAKGMNKAQNELHALQVQFDMIVKAKGKLHRTNSDTDLKAKLLTDKDNKESPKEHDNGDSKLLDIEGDYAQIIKKLSGKARDLELAYENMDNNYKKVRKDNRDLKYQFEEIKSILQEKDTEIKTREMLIVKMKKDSDALEFDFARLDEDYLELTNTHNETLRKLKLESSTCAQLEKQNKIFRDSGKIGKNEYSKRLIQNEEELQAKILAIQKFEQVIMAMEKVITERDGDIIQLKETIKMADMVKGYIRDNLVELLTTAGLGEEHSVDENENFDFDYIIQQLKTFLHAHSQTESEYSSPLHSDRPLTTHSSKKLFKTFIEKCPLE